MAIVHLKNNSMKNQTETLDALVQEKLDADADFQAELETLPEEDKDQAIADKKAELIEAEFKKTKEYGNNQKIRAEKAEAEAKKPKKGEETPKNSEETPKIEFTPKDYLALAQANVPADDLDEVSDYAQFKGISLAEALGSSYIKTILKEKAEERKSAEAASTTTARRISFRASSEALIEKLESNPSEIKEEDIEATVKARIEKLREKK